MSIETLDKYKFHERLTQRAVEKKIPTRAMFELTYQCNLRCRHCYVVPNDHRKELTTNKIFSILDQLADIGTFFIGFTGGEPLVREDIFDILFYAKNRGFKIILKTNGTLIREEVADRIEELRPNKVDVSLYGVKKETHEGITQIPGSFDATMRGIQLLHERKVPLFIVDIIMTLNYQEVKDVRDLAITQMGEHFRYGTYISPKTTRSREVLDLRLPPLEIQKLWDDMIVRPEEIEERNYDEKLVKKEGLKRSHDKLFTCGAGKTEVTINPYGEMKLCLELPEPSCDLLKISFKEAWKILVGYMENIKPGANYECPNCDLRDFCIQCPAKSYLETGDINACVPYFKELAQLRKRMEIR